MTDYSLADISALWAWYEQEALYVSLNRRGTVACIICGRQGLGIPGTRQEIIDHWQVYPGSNWRHWQLLCCQPHIHECLCGIFYPSLKSLTEHVAQHRRYRHTGHAVLTNRPATRINFFNDRTYLDCASKTHFELHS